MIENACSLFEMLVAACYNHLEVTNQTGEAEL